MGVGLPDIFNLKTSLENLPQTLLSGVCCITSRLPRVLQRSEADFILQLQLGGPPCPCSGALEPSICSLTPGP